MAQGLEFWCRALGLGLSEIPKPSGFGRYLRLCEVWGLGFRVILNVNPKP